MADTDFIGLKFGTLKEWNVHSEECISLVKEYFNQGVSASLISQHDTEEQKELLCKLIDTCNAETIYLDWNDTHVSKQEAKKYIREYE